MKTTVSSLAARKKADVLVLPFWEGKKGAEAAFHLKQLATTYAASIEAGDFRGKEKETLFLYPTRGVEKRVLLLGLGKHAALTPEALRLSYAAAVRACNRKKCKQMNLLLPDVEMEQGRLAEAAAEGTFLANYSFTYKKAPKEGERESLLEGICFLDVDKKGLDQILKSAKIASAVHLARDLVNGNADDVTAEMLVKTAKEIAKDFSSVKTTVLGRKELEKEKMGLILAVNRGSANEPALILVEYRGDPKSKDITAFVGKGITFDTGGLNIKPTGSMETMKGDMGGAAAVLGTMRAIASLGLKKNVIGVVAAAENAIGSRSYKPGDVYPSHAGKMVEISNTDAEGRLVLADALSYLQSKHHVNRIVDLATLTGAIVITLGEEVTGLFSNNDALARALTEAGEKTFERVWRLPIYPEFRDQLKSPIADLKNSGGRKGGSITAALFLKEFIKDETPWAHLDIAGTGFLSELSKPYHPLHGTGVGVRLLVEFLERSK